MAKDKVPGKAEMVHIPRRNLFAPVDKKPAKKPKPVKSPLRKGSA